MLTARSQGMLVNAASKKYVKSELDAERCSLNRLVESLEYAAFWNQRLVDME
jgi:hypothetical protein